LLEYEENPNYLLLLEVYGKGMMIGWTCQRDLKRIQKKGGKKLNVLNK
jgi:hypothetical protein